MPDPKERIKAYEELAQGVIEDLGLGDRCDIPTATEAHDHHEWFIAIAIDSRTLTVSGRESVYGPEGRAAVRGKILRLLRGYLDSAE